MALTDSLNIVKQCKQYRVHFWACPHFIFLVMGVVIIAAILFTYSIAQRYADPEIVALIVLGLTAFLFIVSHAVVRSFERIVEAAQAKSEFLNIVSHQLRGPLSVIKWQLDLAREKGDSADIQESRTYSYISKEVERLMHIVNSLIAVNQIEDRHIVLDKTLFPVGPLIEEVIDHFEPVIKQAGVIVNFTSDKDVKNVFADKEKTRIILSRLLDNAIVFSQKAQRKEIFIIVKLESSNVRISVRDGGVGIGNEDQKRIFDKFFRATQAYQLRPNGTGVSLYIVRNYVNALGGKTGFFSEPDKGSTFWFTLPIK